jgi:murein DD-endopeptidase MepM/ murein hydrolase activator NlpD
LYDFLYRLNEITSERVYIVPVTQYKKAEKEVADRLGKWLRLVGNSILAFGRHVTQKGKQRFTVMLIPHSEKKIFNFQISFFMIIFISMLLIIVLAGFLMLATHFTSTNERITKVSDELKTNETTLESLRDEISGFRKVSKDFKAQMDLVLKTIDSQAYLATGVGGPLSTASLASEDTAPEDMRELSELESMKTLMENSIEPLAEVNKALSSFRKLIADTPTLWPLKGTHGNITTRFGMTIDSLHPNWYLHTGIDIAWAIGTPIVATANGTVYQVGYTEDLGLYITLKHKYGIYTKYGHLSSAIVKKGQKVNRGDVIGASGNSGLMTTGPHLHYEVKLGLDYVDPMNFLSIESDISSVKLGGRNGE